MARLVLPSREGRNQGGECHARWKVADEHGNIADASQRRIDGLTLKCGRLEAARLNPLLEIADSRQPAEQYRSQARLARRSGPAPPLPSRSAASPRP